MTIIVEIKNAVPASKAILFRQIAAVIFGAVQKTSDVMPSISVYEEDATTSVFHNHADSWSGYRSGEAEYHDFIKALSGNLA
jgi:hypothetical protein